MQVVRYQLKFLFKSGNTDVYMKALTADQVNQVMQAFMEKQRTVIGEFSETESSSAIDGSALDAIVVTPYTIEVESE